MSCYPSSTKNYTSVRNVDFVETINTFPKMWLKRKRDIFYIIAIFYICLFGKEKTVYMCKCLLYLPKTDRAEPICWSVNNGSETDRQRQREEKNNVG